VAIAIQCFVVQIHVHPEHYLVASESRDIGAVAHVAARRVDSLASEPADQKDGDSSTCIICQQLALAGAVLLPVAPTPRLPQPSLVGDAATERLIVEKRATSHSWQSRAPPLFL
jgi:hypothetical protein